MHNNICRAQAAAFLVLLAISCGEPGAVGNDDATESKTVGDSISLDRISGNDGRFKDLPPGSDVDSHRPTGDVDVWHAPAPDVPPAPDVSPEGGGYSPPPVFCNCPSALPDCVVDYDDEGNVLTYWCSLACEPDNPAALSVCQIFLGPGACCRKGMTDDDVLGDYCHHADRCCSPCGELCCQPGTDCEGDGDACVPVGADYCGNGSWCSPGTWCANSVCCPNYADVTCGDSCCPQGWTCSQEAGLCVPPGGEYCGDGVICPSGSFCAEQAGTTLCVPAGYVPCTGHLCAPGQVCAEGKCCPQLLPIPCGELCCQDSEVCIGVGEACIPEGAEYCGDGGYCTYGYYCAPDAPVCVPTTADYCGQGEWCLPGAVCVGDGCCPQGLPQQCGEECCLAGYECVAGEEACIPAGADYCGQGKWCPPGELCAEGGDICYPVGGEYCGNGHWCEPGKNCAGTTCCGYQDPVDCGSLCCPASYDCINDGEACLPPAAMYCGDGEWCNPGMACKAGNGCMVAGSTECDLGTVCQPGFQCAYLETGTTCCPEMATKECKDKCCPDNYECTVDGEDSYCVMPGGSYCGQGLICGAGYYCASGDKCLPGGWDDCGEGESCPPNNVCTDNGGCCPVGKPVGCGETCCPKGFKCVADGEYNLCLPPGAFYCGEGEWCPVSTVCPEYADVCVPEGATECKWGQLCGPTQVCAIGAEKCCPQGTPVGCGDICCAQGDSCSKLSTGQFCLSPGSDVCWSTELVCSAGSDCSPDGQVCVPQGYTYCGPGVMCPPGTVCSYDGTACGAIGAQHCGGELWCYSGNVCTPDMHYCMPEGADYCGGGKYCQAGFKCSGDGETCVELAKTACDWNTSCPSWLQCSADANSCIYPDPSCGGDYCTYPGFASLGIASCCSTTVGTLVSPVNQWDPPNDYLDAMEKCKGIDQENVAGPLAAGVFDALRDNGYANDPNMNWISCAGKGNELLVLDALWIIDNARGPYPADPDGPFAQLYVDFLKLDPSSVFGLKSADKFKLSDWDEMLGENRKHLRGPHNGECPYLVEDGPVPKCFGTKPVDGWLDSEFMRYRGAGLYKWGTGNWNAGAGSDNKDTVVMVVYEDSGEGKAGRQILGVEVVNKAMTTGECAVWVQLRRFSKPKVVVAGKPTGDAAGYALLRTVNVGSFSSQWNCYAKTPVEAALVVSIEEDVATWPITLEIEYSWDESRRPWLKVGHTDEVAADVASLGGASMPAGLWGYTLDAKMKGWLPPTVVLQLEPPVNGDGKKNLNDGEPLVTLDFRTLTGKAQSNWFKVKKAQIHKPTGPKKLEVQINVINKCFSCGTTNPSSSNGYRCPASSWNAEPCS